MLQNCTYLLYCRCVCTTVHTWRSVFPRCGLWGQPSGWRTCWHSLYLLSHCASSGCQSYITQFALSCKSVMCSHSYIKVFSLHSALLSVFYHGKGLNFAHAMLVLRRSLASVPHSVNVTEYPDSHLLNHPSFPDRSPDWSLCCFVELGLLSFC